MKWRNTLLGWRPHIFLICRKAKEVVDEKSREIVDRKAKELVGRMGHFDANKRRVIVVLVAWAKGILFKLDFLRPNPTPHHGTYTQIAVVAGATLGCQKWVDIDCHSSGTNIQKKSLCPSGAHFQIHNFKF
jgi:hypothetical protein